MLGTTDPCDTVIPASASLSRPFISIQTLLQLVVTCLKNDERKNKMNKEIIIALPTPTPSPPSKFNLTSLQQFFLSSGVNHRIQKSSPTIENTPLNMTERCLRTIY